MTGHTVILWSPQARTQAHRLIDATPLDAVVTVKPPKRTLDQNAKMHAMLTDISLAGPDLGAGAILQPPDDWKCAFMRGLQYEMRTAIGIDGEPFDIGYRSSRMTKEQMSDMIELMYNFGAKYDIQWKEPS